MSEIFSKRIPEGLKAELEELEKAGNYAKAADFIESMVSAYKLFNTTMPESKISEIAKKVQRCTAKINDAFGELSELHIESVNDRNDELHKLAYERQIENEKHSENTIALSEELKSLKKENETLNSENDRLKKENEKLKRKNDDLHFDNTKLKDKILQLNDKMDEKLKLFEKYTKIFSKVGILPENLENEILQRSAKSQNIVNSLDKERSEKLELLNKIGILNKQIQEKDITIKEKGYEIKQAQLQTQSALDKIEFYLEQMDEYKATISELKKESRELKVELKGVQSQNKKDEVE